MHASSIIISRTLPTCPRRAEKQNHSTKASGDNYTLHFQLFPSSLRLINTGYTYTLFLSTLGGFRNRALVFTAFKLLCCGATIDK
ncbi:hypothetical protein E2C01_029940 [Portunus trituberculatus]|uniref:Uncharacterized protein n=1 Tax=Portunus trituberculatus TaxID=210409 RepID=A0A5B7EPM5_PORTR|nr:hypothetical protein [Portunus trituberculatus]